MLGFDPGQGAQDLGEMPAHGLGGGFLVAGIDGCHDGAVLIDQRQHRVRARERQLAHPVHMGLDVLNGFPGQGAPGSFGQRDMEQLIVTLEGVVVVPPGCLFLHLKEIVDPLPALLVEG
jgi:hypothetical protein